LKSLIKALLRRTPYRIVRRGALNRFSAIEEMLGVLRDRGLSPTRIVDGGANIGDFARKAKACFPAAKIDLIEPQPACHGELLRLQATPNYEFHPQALVGPTHTARTISLRVSPGEVTTGAHISPQPGENTVDVPAATLDEILDGKIGDQERIFIKLDLQGYEMEALSGSETTLRRTEVILTEVSFFAQAYEPPIAELVAFLHERGFDLYDIAALGQRARDGRARQGDFLFVRRDSSLLADKSWI